MWLKKFILLACFLCPHAAVAALYKCTTGDNITYQDKPCPAVNTQIILPSPVAPPPPSESSPAPTAPAQSAVNNAPVIARDAQGKIKRSEAAKNAFKAANPCPATGKPAGACPGYVIDHIQALACGGADSPANMQWQTVAAGKEKDAWERDGCTPIKQNSATATTPATTAATDATPAPVIRIGVRGGRYVIGKNGKKRYLPRNQ